jgi:hypothetical protein
MSTRKSTKIFLGLLGAAVFFSLVQWVAFGPSFFYDSPASVTEYNRLKIELPNLISTVIKSFETDEALRERSAELENFTAEISQYTEKYTKAKAAGASSAELQKIANRFNKYWRDNKFILSVWQERTTILAVPIDSALTKMKQTAPKTYAKDKEQLYAEFVTPVIDEYLPELANHMKATKKAANVFGTLE